jgi:hypothetical protein
MLLNGNMAVFSITFCCSFLLNMYAWSNTMQVIVLLSDARSDPSRMQNGPLHGSRLWK